MMNVSKQIYYKYNMKFRIKLESVLQSTKKENVTR